MAAADSPVMLRTGIPAAPGYLALLEGFLNTWSGELDIEDLGTAKATEAWLRGVGLWTGAQRLTSRQHQELVQFRRDLRAWILDKKASDPLNTSLSDINFRAEFVEDRVSFQPTGGPYQILMGTLITSISESQQNGTWDLFKCCELSTCGWAFYDSTRSRTKRWCSMKTCGSRHKAREYYKRKR